MGNIKTKELSKLGYTDNVARSIAMELVAKHCKHKSQDEIVTVLQEIRSYPERFKIDEVWGKLAEVLSPTKAAVSSYDIKNSLLLIIYMASGT